MTHENVIYWSSKLGIGRYSLPGLNFYYELIGRTVEYIVAHEEVYGSDGPTTRATEKIGNDLMGLLN